MEANPERGSGCRVAGEYSAYHNESGSRSLRRRTAVACEKRTQGHQQTPLEARCSNRARGTFSSMMQNWKRGKRGGGEHHQPMAGQFPVSGVLVDAARATLEVQSQVSAPFRHWRVAGMKGELPKTAPPFAQGARTLRRWPPPGRVAHASRSQMLQHQWVSVVASSLSWACGLRSLQLRPAGGLLDATRRMPAGGAPPD